jgi:uncharacterized protein YdeI (YjbR/CyaY-like superfamily)
VEPIYFAGPAEFRAWLEEHHEAESELFVGYHKTGSGRPSMTWPESVDQALCFGWIDGARRRRAYPEARAFFARQPPGYRRTMADWVASAKRPETRERRLAQLIGASAEGRRVQFL